MLKADFDILQRAYDELVIFSDRQMRGNLVVRDSWVRQNQQRSSQPATYFCMHGLDDDSDCHGSGPTTPRKTSNSDCHGSEPTSPRRTPEPLLPSTPVKQAMKTAPAVEQLSQVKLKMLQEKSQKKHAVLEEISRAIQTKRTWSKLIPLGLITGKECNNERTVKVNMALRSAQNGEVVTMLGVARQRHGTAWDEALQELRSMAEVDSLLCKQALDVFSHYTKEGYENVTGNARGGHKLDAVSKQIRPMTSEEEADGEKSLRLLKEDWQAMPHFGGAEVFRVVHAGTAEAALQVGQSIRKQNPTSTPVALDWSRVNDEGKRICKITVVGDGTGPVDIRPVSTYTHEAEILLPPGTEFTLERYDARSLHITARLPGC